jgi:hypothetical protein
MAEEVKIIGPLFPMEFLDHVLSDFFPQTHPVTLITIVKNSPKVFAHFVKNNFEIF